MAGVAGANAFTGRAVGRDSAAVVVDLESNSASVGPFDAERDGAGAGDGFDAVLDGVLDEGLEEECGDGQGQERRIDVPFDAKPVAEAHLFEVEVAVEELEFLAERGGEVFAAVEGMAEEAGELHEHRVGGVDVPVHEGADAVEGVEEEVRVELHPEGMKAGGGEAGFEFEDVAFAFPEGAVVGERVGAGDDDPVHDHVEEEGGNEDVTEDLAEGFLGAAEGDKDLGEGGAQEDPEEREDGARDEVQGDAEAPVTAGEVEAGGKPPGGEGEQSEEVPVGEGSGDGGTPGNRNADLGGGEVVLAGEGEPHDRPDHEIGPGPPGDDRGASCGGHGE